MIRTTVQLREDIYNKLVRGEKRNLSKKINEILEKELFKGGESMFGTMKKADLSDLREHEDRL